MVLHSCHTSVLSRQTIRWLFTPEIGGRRGTSHLALSGDLTPAAVAGNTKHKNRCRVMIVAKTKRGTATRAVLSNRLPPEHGSELLHATTHVHDVVTQLTVQSWMTLVVEASVLEEADGQGLSAVKHELIGCMHGGTSNNPQSLKAVAE